MSDMLREIFERQTALHARYTSGSSRRYEVTGDEERRLLTLAAIAELCEALNETDWKPWKAPRGDGEKLLEELVDVMHFVIELFIVSGFGAEDLYRAYVGKADVNEGRLRDGY